ncbi:hypothetical protein [Mycolicibacterium arenosum]|uniref:Mycobacterium membrane protein n=1 Tax=Mycolicibacterium arenosum TaxID=2952157 RepID=A0ABT1MBY4_9MYCO|nr:hypothetical protein [Mycolicibacterium sp. CAU 1645]MCP9276668.1 hypothetical protein [Mycolicibacterium sp. CAU 1645]
MKTTFAAAVAAPALTMAALAVASGVTPVHADPLPYGPETCINGFVWREAFDGDTVCVTPATRSQVAQQNADPSANKEPEGGAFGPDTCVSGFVWREAFDGDTICVTPDVRAATKADNAADASRKAANAPEPTPVAQGGERTVVFEITGSGTVYSIDTNPTGSGVGENTPVPFKRTIKIGPDVDLLTVVAVTKTGEQGCRITLDGEVVAEQPVGDAFCSVNI